MADADTANADAVLDGLLNISVSDSEDSCPEGSAPETSTSTSTSTSTTKTTAADARKARVAQNEDEFQAVRRGYVPKIEDGELWKSIALPLPRTRTLSKPEAQQLLHAVEELYFFRRYDEAAALVARVLASVRENRALDEEENRCGGGGLDEDTVGTLEGYEGRIARRIGGRR